MKKTIKKVVKIEPVSKAPDIGKPMYRRVCAYCRVSTGSTEQKTSYESQKDYYTRLVLEREDWIFAGIYADQAQTGTKIKQRDGFQQMMQDCRQGRIDLILTKSITRFARNTVDSIRAIRELGSLGIGIYFEKERINTLSEKSEQLLTILSAIAQGESENISTNIRWAVQYRFKSGNYIISSPAYGYQKDENGELIICPEEAVVVRRIFNDYLKGKGAYTIAKELHKEGLPTIRGAEKWEEGTVRWILQNSVYEGDLLYQKTYTTQGVPFVRKYNHGEVQQYLITDDHEPIISREEAQAVRDICTYRREKQGAEGEGTYQNRYAFSSRILCGECGSIFRRQKIYIGKPYEKVQWCCYQHIKDISSCRQKAIREDSIQQAFVRMWNRLASNYEEILAPLLADLKSIPEDPEQEEMLQELKCKIQEMKQQSYMLQKVLIDGDISSAVFIERRNQIETELEETYHRQCQLKGQKLFEQEIAQTEYLITIFRNRPTIMENFEEELFCLIVENVTVLSDYRLMFRLKNGLELIESYGKKV